MKSVLRIFSLVICFVLASPCFPGEQSESPQVTEQSCRSFVQGFYNWYTGHLREPKFFLDQALEQKKREFDLEMLKALKEDYAASAKSPDEIVGLDFDPFLYAQDIADSYAVGDVKSKGRSYFVDVYGIWKGKKGRQPEVVAELVRKNGQWQFVNFYDGENQNGTDDNLLSRLKALQLERQKH